MHWLLEKKFLKDDSYYNLYQLLERYEIPHSFCDVIPFSEELLNYQINNPVFAFGSYSLAKIAAKQYKPGAYISDNLSIQWCLDNYDKNFLNYDTTVTKLKDLDPPINPFFIRPNEDTKSFSGTIMTHCDFNSWRDKILKIVDYSTITGDTLICVSSLKEIQQEYRFFIIDKEIITASQYKLNGQFFQRSNTIDSHLTDFVENMIQKHEPIRAYVMDIAVINGEFYVLELNCINAAGMYDIDVAKFILGVENMGDTYESN